MSAALASINTVIAIKFDGVSYTTVANVGTVNGFGIGTNMIDNTSHSTGAPWKQMFPTLLENKPITFPIFWDPQEPTHAAVTGLIAIQIARTKVGMKFAATDSGAWAFEFDGYVSDFQLTAPVDNVYTANITLTPAGGAAPTITP